MGVRLFLRQKMRRATVAVSIGFVVQTLPLRAEEPRPSLDAHGRATPNSSAGGSEAAGVAMMGPAQAAIDHGLAYLATRQQEDGAFSNSGYGRNAAVVALSGMAWLAGGSTPERGPYGQQVSRGPTTYWIIASRADLSRSRMPRVMGRCMNMVSRRCFWPRCMGCRRATTCATSWPEGRRSDRATRRMRRVAGGISRGGGCRYFGDDLPGDGPAGGTQCGLVRCPHETIDRCVDYVKRSQNADGGFRYMLPGGQSGFPRSAAGIVALYSAGIYEGAEVERGSVISWTSLAPGRCKGLQPDAERISSTGITMRCRRCGTPAASGGSVGIRRFAMSCEPAAARMGRGWTRLARNTARRWPASFCRCRITMCRSFSDDDFYHRDTESTEKARAEEP